MTTPRSQTPALIAVPRMPPRSQQTCTSGIEVDGEPFALGIEVNLPVRSPLGHHRPKFDLDALQDPAEFQLPRVKDPCAVTRLENDDVMKSAGKIRRSGAWFDGPAFLRGDRQRDGTGSRRHWFIPIPGIEVDSRESPIGVLSANSASRGREGSGLTTRSSSAWMVSLSTAPSRPV